MKNLKHILLIMTLLLAIPVMMGASKQAKIEFKSMSHDFGTIHAGKGSVECSYEFTNTGKVPLVIVNVSNGGCGCTTPDYPKEPIAPGKSGKITIHFDPSGRAGEFERAVKVRTNAGGKLTLRFSGVIVP